MRTLDVFARHRNSYWLFLLLLGSSYEIAVVGLYIGYGPILKM